MNRERLGQAVRDGAVIVDVRPVEAFVARHLLGSVFVALSRRRFPGVVRACVPPGSPLVIVAAGAEPAEAARALVAAAGPYPILGVADVEDAGPGGPGLPSTSLDVLTIADLEARLADRGPDFTLLDVRERFEWDLGHIEGAVHVPLGELRRRSATWSAAAGVACICEEGVRSVTAASLLRRCGVRAATVAGGTATWFESGRPITEG